MQTIGQRLAEGRRAVGLARERAAKFLGIPEDQLECYEAGQKEPDMAVALKLADLYGCDDRWLLTGEDEARTPGVGLDLAEIRDEDLPVIAKVNRIMKNLYDMNKILGENAYNEMGPSRKGEECAVRAAVFIDGEYMVAVLKHFGSPRVDYSRFADWACDGAELFRAYYYDCLPYQSAYPTAEEKKRFSDKQRFFTALRRLDRFYVREGRLEYRGTDDKGSPVFVQKRVDLQMGLDIATVVSKNRVGMVVLVTGDSDFVPAVRLARDEGIIVRLVHGPKRSYHQDLWEAVDERRELTEEILKSMLL